MDCRKYLCTDLTNIIFSYVDEYEEQRKNVNKEFKNIFASFEKMPYTLICEDGVSNKVIHYLIFHSYHKINFKILNRK